MLRRPLLFAAGFLAGLTAAAAIARAAIPSRGDATSDELALVAIANGLTLRSRATAFRGGSVSSWMAGGDLDLRAAELATSGARLELSALMSGVVVRLPATWRIEATSRGMTQGLALHLDGQQGL